MRVVKKGNTDETSALNSQKSQHCDQNYEGNWRREWRQLEAVVFSLPRRMQCHNVMLTFVVTTKHNFPKQLDDNSMSKKAQHYDQCYNGNRRQERRLQHHLQVSNNTLNMHAFIIAETFALNADGEKR
jgi:hypothetical protein